MNEAVLLNITSATKVQLTPQGLVVKQQPPKVQASVDNSAKDWSLCCDYFEKQPGATVESALLTLRGKFKALRPNQGYYEQ